MDRTTARIAGCITLMVLSLTGCHGDQLANLHPQLAVACGDDSAKLGAPGTGPMCAKLDFGTVPVGSPKTLILRIENVGRSSMKVEPSTGIDGDDHGTLSATLPPSTLSAGASFDVQITFAPTYSLALSQNYVIDTDDPKTPHLVIPITGMGDGHPNPVVDMKYLDFGDVLTGFPKTLPVHISNQGPVPMTILRTAIQNDLAEFSAPPSTGPVGPSESIDQPVTFQPVGPGIDNANLVITVDSVDSDGKPTGMDVTTIDVSLHGESLPQLAANPDPVAFGTLQWQEMKDVSLTLTNPGKAPIEIMDATLKSGGTPSLSISHHVPWNSTMATIQPGGTLTSAVTVTYAPEATLTTTPVSVSNTLVLTTNDPQSPELDVPISGGCNCAHPGPAIQVVPTSVDFTTVAPDSQGDRTQIITISSVGTAPVVISDISPESGTPTDFIVGSLASPSIAPGASENFTITYHPHPRIPADAPVIGVIDVMSNDPTNPIVPVKLNARCIAPAGSPDTDGDGIPDLCDACLFDGPKAETYPDTVMGDGITIENAAFSGGTNVLTDVLPGASIPITFDYWITGAGPTCLMDSNKITQYYVGTSGAPGDCLFSGHSCGPPEAPIFGFTAPLTAPTEPGTYFVEYDWNWNSMCTPSDFQYTPLGTQYTGFAFAAFCVKPPSP